MIAGQAIELSFDADSENRIAQLPTLIKGGLGLDRLGIRPHISLAVFRPPVDRANLASCMEILSQRTTRFEIEFSSVGAFPGDEGVVFIAPVVTRELLATHELLHAILSDYVLFPDALYSPARWVPHCTVAHGLASSDVSPAVDVARSSNAFGRATVERVTLVEFPPVHESAPMSFNPEKRHPEKSKPIGAS